MKLFSIGKKPKKDNVPDTSISTPISPVDDSKTVNAPSNTAKKCPDMPMAVLAKKLGLKAGEFENDFFLPGESPSMEKSEFLSKLNEEAKTLLNKISIVPGQENSFSSDMSLELHIAEDHLHAFGCLFPPIGGGKKLSFEQLKAIVKSNGIKHEVKENVLQDVFDNNKFFVIFSISDGKAKHDGEDGHIIDMYPRERQLTLQTDQHNTVDYKNLNLIQNVHSGDIICKIIPPKPPEDGIDIFCNVLTGTTGKPPKPPMGKNVIENDDHTALIASCDGQLIFSCGCFKVQQMHTVEDDVDSSTGNLDVIGSVTIKGNVIEGYTVKATEDIIVRGNVEAADLIAGGNIQISQGINGNFKGSLTAGKNISAKYLENCTVTAGGNVKSDSIVNSTVISNDKVSVLSGKGIILCSSVFGHNGIEASSIGNEQHHISELAIGADPKIYYELSTVKNELAEITRKSEENDKNILFLQKAESLDEKYQQLLDTLIVNKGVFEADIAQKAVRVEEIDAELKGSESCQIVANHLYPPVNVTIGSKKLAIDTEEQLCRIFKSDGEITIGKK